MSLSSQCSRVQVGVVRVTNLTIVSTSTRSCLRSGEEPWAAFVGSCRRCRGSNLKVVDCAGLLHRLGKSPAERRGAGFFIARESASKHCRPQLKRCAVVARLFSPGDFDASKLTAKFEGGTEVIKAKTVEDLLPRKYTLTHSDVTGELLLSIGPSFNRRQLTDWYTRLMRDEIVAEWRIREQISLHVHCHVSGGHVLLAPAALRNSIFEREMPLVLEAIRYGDKDVLAEFPELHTSTVWVHFHSSDPAYNRADCWGPLFYAACPVSRATGKLVPYCILEPFTPLKLMDVRKDPVELCSAMSP